MKKLSEIYKRLNKNEWFEPVFVIGMSLTVTLGIVIGVHSIFGQADVTIADNTAEEYFYEGKYDEAIDEFGNLQKDEEWPIWKVKQAEVYSIKGDYDKSNSLLKEAVIIRNKLIQKDSSKYLDKDNEFINEVVFTFFMNKEYDQAVSLGEDYIINNEEYKPLMRTMLAVYMSLGEEENAKDIVKEYNMDKDSAYDMSVYANMQMVTGDIKGAIKTLKDAFEVDNDEINILDVLNQLANYDRDEVLNSINELVDNDEVYNLFLAKIYSMDETEYDEAIDILDSLDESLKDNLVYAVLKAQLLSNKGNEKEATDIINSIINNKENGYAKYYIEAMEYLKQGEYDKAIESCKKSILENNDYADNYGILLPEILIAKNDIDSIESYFRKAILKEPFNISMIINIGNYYYNNLKQYDKASQYYELASKLKPNDSNIYYLLGNVEVNKEKYEVAIEYFEKAISLESENGKYFRALGTAYYNLGDYEEALNNIREAYSLDENDVLALNNAGCYYMMVEKDVWRGFSNIEAAYEEMPESIDENIKKKIIDNYNKAKTIFDKYIEDEDMDINMPIFELFY
ncbi:MULTISPECIES: tetratricopeptide repeat protein [Clostridium]|uniref:Tetratricopeptide TPR_2 repeat-containing protein n=1 Tax=Clostridium disporicum TaxID=84024 RepID=A0A174DRP2_9CLOT|nr:MULTISPECIES: tetratricopeptide repeat protein [Clostridium]MCD2500430.1 tetratricopeptide repeat protein [Clostridium sp. NSJ-145]CUO28143.1 tetratricopeptide TPR_2 repeat-containing protein [Clostridium disporicum]